jgi:hypothetical protein
VIKFILYLCKFPIVNSFMERLFFSYGALKKDEEVMMKLENKKAEVLAREELKRIVAYEKYGEASGFEAPIIAKAGG